MWVSAAVMVSLLLVCLSLSLSLKVYMKVFQSSDLPKPKSMLMATAEANNISAQVTAYDKYSRDMELVSGRGFGGG